MQGTACLLAKLCHSFPVEFPFGEPGGRHYKEFLSKLAAYWVEHRAVQSMDVQGLINVITACPVLLSNAGQFDPEYFDEIFKSFLQSTIRNYITL